MSENVFQVPINSTILLKQEDIDDIMCAALEGGICYWCGEAEVLGAYFGTYASEQIARGGTLLIHDAESDDCWDLTLEKFLEGVKLWYTSGMAGNAVRGDGTVDTYEIDGAAADAIVQLALFGEIVFG